MNKLINIKKDIRYIVIPWSGGLDSTAILMHLADDVQHNKDKYSCIQLRVESFTCASNQGVMEKGARTKLKTYLKLKYPKFTKKVEYVETKMDYCGEGWHGDELHQPFWWVTHVRGHYGSNIQVLMGYISGDCFWTIKADIDKLLEGVSKYFSNQTNFVLDYPLKSYKKNDVFALLEPEILPMISTCQDGEKGKRCNQCVKCREYQIGTGELFKVTPEVSLTEKELTITKGPVKWKNQKPV